MDSVCKTSHYGHFKQVIIYPRAWQVKGVESGKPYQETQSRAALKRQENVPITCWMSCFGAVCILYGSHVR